jgi:methyl-accepting chemotaxis protein
LSAAAPALESQRKRKIRLKHSLFVRCCSVLLFLSIVCLPAVGRQSDASVPARVAQLLERSGYKYTKAADNIWTIPFSGKNLGQFQLFVTSAEGLIVAGAIVATKDSMKLTPELMEKLLHLAHNLDRVKIGLDNDGDLFVRIEVSARTFDDTELKSNFEQVAAAADEIRAAIKPLLK